MENTFAPYAGDNMKVLILISWTYINPVSGPETFYRFMENLQLHFNGAQRFLASNTWTPLGEKMWSRLKLGQVMLQLPKLSAHQVAYFIPSSKIETSGTSSSLPWNKNTASWWRKALWIDESKTKLWGQHWKHFVWGKANTMHHPEDTNPSLKQDVGNIIWWGCFSSSGREAGEIWYRPTGLLFVNSLVTPEIWLMWATNTFSIYCMHGVHITNLHLWQKQTQPVFHHYYNHVFNKIITCG